MARSFVWFLRAKNQVDQLYAHRALTAVSHAFALWVFRGLHLGDFKITRPMAHQVAHLVLQRNVGARIRRARRAQHGDMIQRGRIRGDSLGTCARGETHRENNYYDRQQDCAAHGAGASLFLCGHMRRILRGRLLVKMLFDGSRVASSERRRERTGSVQELLAGLRRRNTSAAAISSAEGSQIHSSSLCRTAKPRCVKNWLMPIGETRI